MAKKLTKTEAKKQAEQLRVKVIGLMGALAGGKAWALEDLRVIGDDLTVKLSVTDGADPTPFFSLLHAWRAHGYRPTMRADADPRYAVLADLYDFFQARSGLDVKAYRGN